MKIAVGCDHRGFTYKERIKKILEEKGNEVKDFGAFSEESVDYPDFAFKVGESVSTGESLFGILICSSGVGVNITANKVKGVRAVQGCSPKMAEMSRRHNNANVITFGQDMMEFGNVEEAMNIFLTTEFEGGRHERRVEKITQLTGK